MNFITSNQPFTKEQLGSFSVATAIGYRGTGQTGFEILTAGDLNKDGYDDLVISCRLESNPEKDGEMKVLVLFFNPNTKVFEFNEKIQSNLSASLFPRRAAVLDFNNDGFNDLYVGDHGVDGNRTGFQNGLYLQTDQLLKSWSPFSTTPVDYSHGVVVADFNKDGRSDVLVLNSFLNQAVSNGISNSYIIGSVGEKNTSIQKLQFTNSSQFNFDKPNAYMLDMSSSEKANLREYLSGYADDLNHDGLPDLILAGSTNGSKNGFISIFKTIKIGQYDSSIDIPLNTDFTSSQNLKNEAVGVSEFTTYDIDRDGQLEIIATLFSQSNNGGGWSGLFFQVLKENPNGTWQDISSSVFPEQYSDQTSNNKWAGQPLTKVDLDGDGDLDLVLTSGGGTSEARSPSSAFWIFDKGQFFPWKPNGVASNNDGGNYPTVVDLNGEKHIVWLDFQWDGATQSAVNNFFKVSGIQLPSSTVNQKFSQLTNIGTALDNAFESMAGDTHFYGNAGFDSVKYFGDSNQYELQFNSGQWNISNISNSKSTEFVSLNDGLDILESIEKIQFLDRSIMIESKSHGSYSDIPTELYQFFITAFNAAPGVTYMDQLAEAYRYGLSVKKIVDIFTTKTQFTDVYSPTLSHADMATQLVTNIVKNSATISAKTEAITDIKGALDIGWTVGDVIYTVFGNLAHKSLTDTNWGNTAKQFNNEIAVAKYYTETLSQSTTDLETLRDVIQPVTQNTNVSSDTMVAQLIGVALMTGGTGY